MKYRDVVNSDPIAAKQQRRIVVGSVLVALMFVASVLLSGASEANVMDAQCSQAEAGLLMALHDQASLVYELARGGSDVALDVELSAYAGAQGVYQKLAAAEQLNAAMDSALEQLAPGHGGEHHQELAFELAGGWERVEQARHQLSALNARRQALRRRPDVRLAHLLGL